MIKPGTGFNCAGTETGQPAQTSISTINRTIMECEDLPYDQFRTEKGWQKDPIALRADDWNGDISGRSIISKFHSEIAKYPSF